MNRRDLLKRAALYPLALRSRLNGLATNQARAINALRCSLSSMQCRFCGRFPGRVLGRRRASASPDYRITMPELCAKMHRDLFRPGCGSMGPKEWAVVEAPAQEHLLIEWRNELPSRHFLPIDYSFHGSGHELPESRTVVRAL